MSCTGSCLVDSRQNGLVECIHVYAFIVFCLFAPFYLYHRLDKVALLVPSAVSSRRGRLVTQDLLDPLVDLGINLGQNIESLDILVNLFRLGSSELLVSITSFFKSGDLRYRWRRSCWR